MTVAAELAPYDARYSDAALALQQRDPATIPWWAIELLDLRQSDPLYRVRALLRYKPPRWPAVWDHFATLVQRAEQTVMRRSIEEWRELCYNDTDQSTGDGGDIATIVRNAARFNPRAFAQLCDLRDEEGEVIHFEDFHLQMIKGMRMTVRLTMIMVFYSGGKSWISSTIVPLMDWAEWPLATEGRIYLDEDTIKKWTGRLMQIVESNDAMHRLFPWIRKPRRGDPGHKIWSYDGFAIGGNSIQQRSFEAHTIGSSKTGFRYMRTGIDDVVSLKEAGTPSIQERNLAYIKAVALTMRQVVRRPTSVYGTKFPGFYVVGTPYDRGDVNVQLDQEYKQRGYNRVRIPVFVNRDDSRSRWPRRLTPSAIRHYREEMGPHGFNMRMKLELPSGEHTVFPEQDVDFALKDGRADPQLAQWCVVPPFTKLIVGFDPASGRRPSHHGARYPAFVVYGVRDAQSWRPNGTMGMLRDQDTTSSTPSQPDLFHEVIQWGRMEGVGFHAQCQRLVELARMYGCPVAFENNTLQSQYGEEIARIALDVTTLSHHTGMNVRDPEQGVEQFEPIVRNRRLVIHASEAPVDAVKALRDELVGWPTHGFRDLVMALWIARYQFALNIQVNTPVAVRRREMPDYVQRFQRGENRLYARR